MGRWGIRSLETGVTRECSISRGGARLYSGGTIYVLEESEEESQCYDRGGSSKSESCLEL